MRILGLVAISLLSSATVAVAKEPVDDKVICKRQQDADTGSHFATTKKVCLKRSEWRQMENAAEDSLRLIRERGGVHPNIPGSAGGGPG